MAVLDALGFDVLRTLSVLFRCDTLFNTYCFILLFLPAVLTIYWLLPTGRARLGFLTLSSLVFYGFWDARFIPLLLGSSLLDFLVAKRIVAAGETPARKRWLMVSLAINLGLLAFFKYALFVAENARSLFDLLGVPVEIPGFYIVLPIGISFYTFQTMSYTIDVYRGLVEPTRSFTKYLTYVTMFPQLVAGPIVRYRTLDGQLDTVPRRLPLAGFVLGLSLFIFGLSKKVVLADTIGRSVDPLWADPASLGLATAWFAAVGYTTQLYFDFSGYSDMAIGLGAMLGFAFPVNFRAPHHSLNPSEWWRRWHITLSTFFRDYIYVPLGGNRVDHLLLYRNLMVIMVLSGLWHGSSWNFILFGIYHGLLLIGYQAMRKHWDAWPARAQQALMMLLWVLGLVLFRAPDLDVAGTVYAALLAPTHLAWGGVGFPETFTMVSAFIFTLFAKPLADRTLRPTVPQAIALGGLLLLALAFMGAFSSPFLYYQF
ncbi:MAG: MBOAT family O-acyltransferase [Thermoplasmatota archaeon]